MDSNEERHNELVINFMRRNCEATEKVADKIGTLTFWVALLGSSIAFSLILIATTG